MFINKLRSGDIETWTICRPERLNAIGTTLAEELTSALATYKKTNKNQRMLLIRAQPCQAKKNRVWIAGGDLKELKALDEAGARQYAVQMSRFCQELRRLPQLVVTVVQGHALGGGAELALFGDIRLGSHDACFAFPQLQVGLPTGYGGGRRLVQLVGLAQAQKWIYLSQLIKPEALVTFGVLHQAFTEDTALEQGLEEICHDILRKGPIPLAQQKKILEQAGSEAQDLEFFLTAWRNPAHEAFLTSW